MMKPYYNTLEDVYVVNNILFIIIFFEKMITVDIPYYGHHHILDT